MTTQTAPERIELLNGYYLENHNGIFYMFKPEGEGIMPYAPWVEEDARAFAAAMQAPAGGAEPSVWQDMFYRVVEFFDKDPTASSFLPEDGDGGFVRAIALMAREIDMHRSANPDPSSNAMRELLEAARLRFIAEGIHDAAEGIAKALAQADVEPTTEKGL